MGVESKAPVDLAAAANRNKLRSREAHALRRAFNGYR
jgi:hypothetical protein